MFTIFPEPNVLSRSRRVPSTISTKAWAPSPAIEMKLIQRNNLLVLNWKRKVHDDRRRDQEACLFITNDDGHARDALKCNRKISWYWGRSEGIGFLGMSGSRAGLAFQGPKQLTANSYRWLPLWSFISVRIVPDFKDWKRVRFERIQCFYEPWIKNRRVISDCRKRLQETDKIQACGCSLHGHESRVKII
jgi:hypothetical protein